MESKSKQRTISEYRLNLIRSTLHVPESLMQQQTRQLEKQRLIHPLLCRGLCLKMMANKSSLATKST
jgi:hypothetical protein